MKQFTLFTLFLAFAFCVHAQEGDIVILPSDDGASDHVDMNFDLSDVGNEFVFDGNVQNTTGAAIEYGWVKINVEKPETWDVVVCDEILCYAPFINENPDELELPANGLQNLDVHFQPNGDPGCASATIQIFLEGNPEVVYHTQNYSVRINMEEDCETIVNAIDEQEVAALNAYPNPVSSTFMLSNNEVVDEIVIYNIIGRQVATYQHENGKQYDLANLPDGIYLASLINKEEGAVKTIRLSKRAVRP